MMGPPGMRGARTDEAIPSRPPSRSPSSTSHGYLVVEDAIPKADLDELETRCQRLIEEKDRLANDWAWDEKESLENRSFRIIQSSPSFVWREIAGAAYRQWLVEFGSEL